MTAPKILTDLNKTALIAAIAATLSLLWGFIAQILTFPQGSSSDLIVSGSFFLVILILEMAMPLFLFVLYRTDIRLSLTRTMRFLIYALIAVLAAGFLMFIRRELRLGMFPDAGRPPLSGNRYLWSLVPPGSRFRAVSHLISTVLEFLARLLSILFFVALAKQIAPETRPARAAKNSVKKAAAIAIVARALLMIFGIFGYMAYAYATRAYWTAGRRPGALSSLLTTLLFETPALLVPWIVYSRIRSLHVADSL